MAEHVDPVMLRPQPLLAVVYGGYLLLGLLMAFAYARLMPLNGSWRTGALFGMATAAVWLMPYMIVLMGVYRFPAAAVPLDFAWALVEQGLGGIVVSLVLKPRAAELRVHEAVDQLVRS
jgi:hypothetical protein